jgi:hypothetical protein
MVSTLLFRASLNYFTRACPRGREWREQKTNRASLNFFTVVFYGVKIFDCKTSDKPLAVVAMCVSNPDCSPVGSNR